MSKAKRYSGTVASVVYEAEDFRILRVSLDGAGKKGDLVAVKGNFPAQNVSVGTWISFEAKLVSDPRYGDQLSVTCAPAPVGNWTDEAVLSALSSQGVGPIFRMQLQVWCRKNPGTTLQDLLDTGDLSLVSQIDDKNAEFIVGRWRALRTYLDTAQFMAQAGLAPAVISRVWKTLGTDLEEVVSKDPWILVRVGGVSFKEADEVARRLGVSLDSPGRVRGAVLSAAQEITRNGHVFATTGQVKGEVARMVPDLGDRLAPQIAEGIRSLIESKNLVLDRTRPGTVALYGRWHHRLEIQCAELLKQRASQPVDEKALILAYSRCGDAVRDVADGGGSLEEVVTAALSNWAASTKIPLSPKQTRAAILALMSPVSLLTGLPGTGKTTTLKAVVAILRDSQTAFLLAAPTGIAAKRMESVARSEAATVHRAFGAKGFKKDQEEREATYVGVTGDTKKSSGESSSKEGEDWGYGPDNHHPASSTVVDECSMLDLHMLYRILSATAPGCRLVLVGDPYQLPSVGSGDVLHDLVRSGVFPHTHLSQIFRQEGTSGIILAAHAMHRGEVPESDDEDFILVPASTEEEAGDIIVKLARKMYDKRLNFQVLSPRHAGGAGVTALNERLRAALNPGIAGVAEMRLGKSVVREDDRVMVTKNDYNLGVFNGDVGKISRIDRRAKEIEVKIFEGELVPDRLVRFPFGDAFKSLRLAYAQTVHKSQGQEYDYIVLPVLSRFGFQLLRNLYYTGITRAKRKVFLVGQASAFARAVENNDAETRNSLLSDRLKGLLPTLGSGN
jgi:exodeoxyribonuclease V alpha subunit